MRFFPWTAGRTHDSESCRHPICAVKTGARTQQPGDRLEQLLVIEDWLRDNRPETIGKKRFPVDIAGVCRQRYGRDTAVPGDGADRREALQAVDWAHANVQHHQVWL